MPRSSTFSLIDARADSACAASDLTVHGDIDPLGRYPVALEIHPFRRGVGERAPMRGRNKFATGPIGSPRSLKLHVV
jgi:hypothetical protein